MTFKSKHTFDEVKNLLRGSANPVATLSALRPTLNKTDIIRLTEWLPKFHRNGRGVFQWQYPRRISDLRRQGVLREISADKELVWASRRLSQNAEKLNGFRSLAQRFELELTEGNYRSCQIHLDEIEKNYGFSNWLIENRIATLQLIEGIEAQKSYAMSIRDARGGNDLVSYLAFCISHRNENAVSIPHYVSQIAAGVDPERGVDPDIRLYVLYRCTNQAPKSEQQVATLVRFEENSGIVDLYETFLRLAIWSVATSEYDLKKCFLREIEDLAETITDYRLSKCLFVGGRHSYLSRIAPIPTDLSDHVVAGRYDKALTTTMPAKDESNINPIAWLTEARARSEDATSPRDEDFRLSSIVVNLARSVIKRTDDGDDAIAKLFKIRLNFRLLNFSSTIEPFLIEAVSSDPLQLGTSEQIAAFVDNPVLAPEIYRFLPVSELREKYGGRLLETCSHSPSIYFEIMRTGDACHPLPAAGQALLSSEFLAEMNSERNLRIGDYQEALKHSVQLAKSSRRTFSRKALQFQAYAFLRCKQIAELTEFIVAASLEDKSMVRNLPLKECAQALDKKTRRLLRANLSTSILLDLYSRNVSESLDSERSFAYEDFLISHGFERPSELSNCIDNFQVGQLKYYLRYLCIPPVMERSAAFGGTKDLEDERLKVLALLAKIDPDNTSDYSTEMSVITRNTKIRQGVMHAEQSKISIDGPALRRWAHLNIKESFNRYKTFLSTGLHGDTNSQSTVELADSSTDRNPTREKDFLDVPTNEALDVVRKMIHALFYECTTNPEHGLDCYLSIRIRHGPLYGQLRSPLEKEEIISQKQSDDSSEYNSHPSWNQRLNYLDYTVRGCIIDRLKEFSRDYDSLINRIANELIQIKTKEKKNGLFVITEEIGGLVQIKGVGVSSLAAFIVSIKEDTSFDAFLDGAFDLFWESVEQSLKNIRALIDTTLKEELARLFTALENDIALSAGDGATADLNTSIRVAKTNAQEALDRIKEWFRLSKPLMPPELAFEDLVHIGLQIVCTMHPEFDPVINMDIPRLPLIEGVLERFFDIFQLIFDNIRKHSGCGRRPTVKIKLVHADDRFKVTVENEVAVSVRTPEAEAKIQGIKQSIEQGLYQSGVRSEGGSGLFKLRARIGSVQGQSLPLDFGFSTDGWFYVRFEVAIRHVGEVEP